MNFGKTAGKYVDKKLLAAISEFLESEDFLASADTVASAFGASAQTFSRKSSDFDSKLIMSFQKNLSLLIQKTWVEKSDAELKENVLYKLNEYCESVSGGAWNNSYLSLLQIVNNVVYLMFGNLAKSADFEEYALRVDPEFGIFWLYIENLPAEQNWSKEKVKTAMLLGMYFLANY